MSSISCEESGKYLSVAAVPDKLTDKDFAGILTQPNIRARAKPPAPSVANGW
jgi:hypothetical protein